MHDAFFDIGVDVVETASFGSFAVPLGEYGIAERSHELNVAAARIAREVADGHGGPGRPARWGPARSSPRLGQIRFADLRDAYEVQARGLLEGGVDLFLVETQFDLLGCQGRDDRLPPGHGRRGPRGADPGAGDHGGHGHDAARHRDQRRAGRPRRHAPRRRRHQLRHRPRRDERAPPLPRPALPRPDRLPAQRRHAVGEGREDALRPHAGAAGRVPGAASSRDFGVQVVGGCCGTTAEHIAAVVEAVRDLEPAPRTVEHEDGATSIYSFTPVRAAAHVPARSASAPTPTAPRSSARPCSRATGTCASRWPASRRRRAPTSSTCASTTSAATARPTWTRSPAASPPRPPCRS